MTIRHVRPHDQFPSGDSLALFELAADPAMLTARYGLIFEERCDDLDRYRLAAIALADGSQVWLVRYHGEPGAGTTVYVDAAADPELVEKLIVDALSLVTSDMRWVAPALTAARGGPA